MKAIWNGKIIAESDHTVILDDYYYFPTESLKKEYFKKGFRRSTCPHKGVASYYSLDVDGEKNENAAWYYPEPKQGVEQIRDMVGFWKGVIIRE